MTRSSLARSTRRLLRSYNTYNALVESPRPQDGLISSVEKGNPPPQSDTQYARSSIVIKDNICTSKEPTTCASGILLGFQSPFVATVVSKLQDAGIIVWAKSNLDEFGMGSHSVNSVHGPVKSLHMRDGESLSAGGSSGGSAVSVARGDSFAALGTDTGGSVRLPAAYTGLVGFKPSFGLISRRGVVAYANSLDTVGIITRTSKEAKEIFDITRGYDSHDPTSIGQTRQDAVSQKLHESYEPRSLRIGVPLEYNIAELNPLVRKVWIKSLKSLQKNGHLIQPISLPTTKSSLSAYYVIAPAEASSNLAKYDGVRYGRLAGQQLRGNGVLYSGTRGAAIGSEARRRILLGSYSLSAAAFENYFIKAQQVRRQVQRDFDRVFASSHPLHTGRQQPPTSAPRDQVDVIVTPTALSVPPKLRDIENQDPVSAYAADILTVPASLAGLPAINVPVHIDESDVHHKKDVSTIGVQIIAQYGDESTLFAAAKIVESLGS